MFQSKKPPFVSFELFPARDDAAVRRQNKAIDGLLALRPDFMSVTFGAGGSTREGSYELVRKLLQVTADETEVVAYVAAYGLDPEVVRSVVRAYVDLGVETLFCIRGDEPQKNRDFRPHPDAFAHASDLLAFVSTHFDVCTGAAGYPEGHKDAACLDDDLDAVKRKVDNGAEFIISQYCYDNRFFFEFLNRCRQRGITVPILAGIMPIYTLTMTENLAQTCGASITDELNAGLAGIDTSDNAAVAAFGVDFLVPKCRELVENGVDGLHFYTMNKSKSVAAILEAIGLHREQLSY
ncbi:MAG TPA: methylenetetrahydrofolate reductase [bacterium]|nr:methylenetetrahydrofolate reductase [bacterium]